jgi:hypothetical protein
MTINVKTIVGDITAALMWCVSRVWGLVRDASVGTVSATAKATMATLRGSLTASKFAGEWVLILSGAKKLWSVILQSCRTPSVPIVFGILILGAYLWGHHEARGQVHEAKAALATAVKVEAQQSAALAACTTERAAALEKAEKAKSTPPAIEQPKRRRAATVRRKKAATT